MPLFFLGCLFDTKNSPAGDAYSVDAAGLPPAQATRVIEAKAGDTLRLKVEYVRKEIAGRNVRMLGFNGSIPGPTLKVPQGAEITVILTNGSDVPMTLHSHGVRLDYHFDGVDGYTQKAVAPGDSFVYRLHFPDAGVFWYHSHYREDFTQEMGLYGNFIVVPADSTYWNPVDREVTLVLDDIQLDSGAMHPFRVSETDHTLMGRFGSTLLINGDTGYTLTVKRKEVVRFYVTNAANARVFNFGIDQSQLKIAGGDNGRYETSVFSPLELIAPGERSVFEVYFNDTATHEILHSTPGQTFVMGRIRVTADMVGSGNDSNFFSQQDTCAQVIHSIDPFRPYFGKEPDEELILTGTMGAMAMDSPPMPMAMKIAAPEHDPQALDGMGIEWTDHMADVNEASTTRNMRWIIRDKRTGLENHDILWKFKTGDKVMIRIYNDSAGAHPMPHPIHFHGQRFLVVNVNGKRNFNMAWKDTFLIGRGATADLLLDASNPGSWMAHCHIAEHMEDMMMFFFRIED